jgi:hypothetical protein
MKKMFLLFVLFSLTFNGCLLFKTVSYEISITDELKGKSLVIIEDISTDAENDEELNNDRDFVFNYAAQSNEFIKDLESEGKKIVSRKLFLEGNKLNAMVTYEFDNITEAESIYYDPPYYFLNLSPEDSIISTNGQIFEYEDYKRILWDNSIRILKFKIFSEQTNRSGVKSLAPYFNK